MLSATAVIAPALPESPFRGIESFRYVDEPIFFARGEETSKLLRYVTIYRGVLFYGESGCGKSSLINAGFIPAIIAEGFTPDRLRVQPKPGEEIIVERISTKDTGDPPYLPSNFIGPDDKAARIVLSADKLLDQLQALRVSSPARRPLLIFDQFEEFATLFEDAPRGEALEQAQNAQLSILQLLVQLQRDATLPVKLLFSFREDYLAKLSKLVAQWPDLSDQSLRLTPPHSSSLPTIVRGSFEKYPGSFGKELSPTLTNNLVAALEERNEGGKVNLSEVQITCLQLWKANDPDALFKAKGVQGLLEDYLSDSLNRLSQELREPAVALLSRMVTPSGTRNIVSEYDLISQANEDEKISEEIARKALRALVQETKLVRRERRYDTYFYDIVSEFLVPWIRRKKIERIATIEQQKQRKKFFRIAAVGTLVGVVLITGLLAYIYFQRQQAYREILKNALVAQAQAEATQAKAAEAAATAAAQQAKQDKINADGVALAALAAKTKAEGDLAKQQEQLTKLQEENRKQTQQMIIAVDAANDNAAKKATRVYELLQQIFGGLQCDKVKGWQQPGKESADLRDAYNSCNQAKKDLGRAMGVLREIGATPRGVD